MVRKVYGVLEATDSLFINFFLDRESCNRWVASERMGDMIIGPFELETFEDAPFNIILGCNSNNTVEDVYLEGEKYGDHRELFGPYTVYEDVEAFDEATSGS